MFSDTRDPSFPDVPTAKELGYKIPSVITVYGVQAPPKTPAAVVKVLGGGLREGRHGTLPMWSGQRQRQMTLKSFTSVEYMEYIVKEAYPTVETYQGADERGPAVHRSSALTVSWALFSLTLRALRISATLTQTPMGVVSGHD